MKTIEIVIASNGESKLETKGFTGTECLEASRFIEKALGQTDNDLLKPEFYSQSSQQNSINSSNSS